jgi:ferric-dicitrate binding protein FerR (iron transport regulator)
MTKKTARQIRREVRRAEYWGAKYAAAEDPQAKAVVVFDRLRATLPRHDARWPHITAVLTEFDNTRERTGT